ncbi:hypothetical protein JCM8547_006777 [Rhodosporidiobolus lusitaniae]
MNRPTLSTLPEDVLEEIFRDLETGLTWRDNRIKVFLPLNLVCRSLLPVSRRFLLAEPLAGKCIWNIATKLLSSLKANGGSSGRAVRSLEELASWMSILQNLDAPKNLSFQIRGQTKGFSWAVAMLNACPRLKEVGVTFRDTTQLNKIVAALSRSFATLRTIRIELRPADAVGLKMVHTFVNKLTIESLDTLEIVGAKDDNLLSSTRLPFRLKELVVHDNALSVESALTLLPANLSSFRSLDIHPRKVVAASLLDLVTLVGPTLTSLSLSPPPPYYSAAYSLYGHDHSGFLVPSEIFSRLPYIKHLSLSNSRALSVARVKALSNASPHLVSLVAEDCIWVADDGVDATSPGWEKRIFPQVELASLFEGFFANLETLDVGFVPVRKRDGIGMLQAAMDRKGVSLEWHGCVSRCPTCGQYH